MRRRVDLIEAAQLQIDMCMRATACCRQQSYHVNDLVQTPEFHTTLCELPL